MHDTQPCIIVRASLGASLLCQWPTHGTHPLPTIILYEPSDDRQVQKGSLSSLAFRAYVVTDGRSASIESECESRREEINAMAGQGMDDAGGISSMVADSVRPSPNAPDQASPEGVIIIPS